MSRPFYIEVRFRTECCKSSGGRPFTPSACSNNSSLGLPVDTHRRLEHGNDPAATYSDDSMLMTILAVWMSHSKISWRPLWLRQYSAEAVWAFHDVMCLLGQDSYMQSWPFGLPKGSWHIHASLLRQEHARLWWNQPVPGIERVQAIPRCVIERQLEKLILPYLLRKDDMPKRYRLARNMQSWLTIHLRLRGHDLQNKHHHEPMCLLIWEESRKETEGNLRTASLRPNVALARRPYTVPRFYSLGIELESILVVSRLVDKSN